jgi:hypothetical protein
MGINSAQDSIFFEEITKKTTPLLHIPYIIRFTSPITRVLFQPNTLV